MSADVSVHRNKASGMWKRKRKCFDCVFAIRVLEIVFLKIEGLELFSFDASDTFEVNQQVWFN